MKPLFIERACNVVEKDGKNDVIVTDGPGPPPVRKISINGQEDTKDAFDEKIGGPPGIVLLKIVFG